MGARVNLAAALADDDVDDEMLVDAAPDEVIRSVALVDVALNPLNKRAPGEDEEIAAMAETIAEFGVVQAPVVASAQAFLDRYPAQKAALHGAAWVVLIGNRRLRAARLAGLRRLDIVVNDERVASMSEVMLVENGQRVALPAWLEAEAMADVLAERGISQRELARRIGKSAPYVGQRLALLRLVPELRELLEQGELTIEQARTFADLGEDEQRAIAGAGAPYRRPSVHGVNTRRPAPPRTIKVSTPAAAAASLAEQFDGAELRELIKLLRVSTAATTAAHATTPPPPEGGGGAAVEQGADDRTVQVG